MNWKTDSEKKTEKEVEVKDWKEMNEKILMKKEERKEKINKGKKRRERGNRIQQQRKQQQQTNDKLTNNKQKCNRHHHYHHIPILIVFMIINFDHSVYSQVRRPGQRSDGSIHIMVCNVCILPDPLIWKTLLFAFLFSLYLFLLHHVLLIFKNFNFSFISNFTSLSLQTTLPPPRAHRPRAPTPLHQQQQQQQQHHLPEMTTWHVLKAHSPFCARQWSESWCRNLQTRGCVWLSRSARDLMQRGAAWASSCLTRRGM